MHRYVQTAWYADLVPFVWLTAVQKQDVVSALTFRQQIGSADFWYGHGHRISLVFSQHDTRALNGGLELGKETAGQCAIYDTVIRCQTECSHWSDDYLFLPYHGPL